MVSWTIGRGQSLPRAVLPERLPLDCQHQSDTSCSLKNKRYLTQVRTLVNRALTDKDPRRAVMVVDRCMVLPYLEASTLLEQLKRERWTSRTDTASRSILQRDGWSAGVVVREPDRGLCRVEYDGLEGKGHRKGAFSATPCASIRNGRQRPTGTGRIIVCILFAIDVLLLLFLFIVKQHCQFFFHLFYARQCRF